MPDLQTAQRHIAIDCNVGRALAFVGDAHNLPAWTYFFRKEIENESGRIRFETPIGECVTRIQTKRGADWAVARILSRFERGEESALMRFIGTGTGQTVASFHATFPPELPHNKRTALLEQLERELLRLKTILELKESAE